MAILVENFTEKTWYNGKFSLYLYLNKFIVENFIKNIWYTGKFFVYLSINYKLNRTYYDFNTSSKKI